MSFVRRHVFKIVMACAVGAPFLLVVWLHLSGRLHHGAIMELFMKGSNAAHHTKAAVDPNVFDAYVGVFQLSDGRTVSVSRSGEHLFAMASGSPQREIFPESQTSFFYADVPAQLRFDVDPITGKTTALTLSVSSRPPLQGLRRQ